MQERGNSNPDEGLFRRGAGKFLGKRILLFLLVGLPCIVYRPLKHVVKPKSEHEAEASSCSLTVRWELDQVFGMQNDSFAEISLILGESVGLSYIALPGYYHKRDMANGTIRSLDSSNSWDRVRAEEVSSGAGFAAIVLHDAADQRAVVAYRGSCSDPADQRCLQDSCASWYIDGGSSVKALLEPKNLYGAMYCFLNFGTKELDYVSQAIKVARSVCRRFPSHEVILTGHSLGALLAVISAAVTGLQAVTFGLPRVDLAMATAGLQVLGGASDFWSIYHPHDPIYMDALAAGSQALKGVRTCVYKDATSPASCSRCLNVSPNSECKAQCFQTHLFKHYLGLLNSRDRHGKILRPACSTIEVFANISSPSTGMNTESVRMESSDL